MRTAAAESNHCPSRVWFTYATANQELADWHCCKLVRWWGTLLEERLLVSIVW